MLPEDYDLTRQDIQLLSSRDALVAFFAKLGYDTNVRLPQNSNAMGISNDTLRGSITHIERLAQQEALGLLFEIYLFELKTITVSITQNLVRVFRDRPSDYLLILTSDYQELDFVLVQRYIPLASVTPAPSAAQQDTPIGTLASLGSLPTKTIPASVQPRILTVNRLNPDHDRVAMRVLRRFSCTESNTIQQYEKLLSAYDVADWSEPFFNNRALFSDYYLLQRLPNDPVWNNTSEIAAMTRAFRALRTLYADAREAFAKQPAQNLKTQLLAPTLSTLGFSFETSSTSPNNPAITTITPDYRLYPQNHATAKTSVTTVTSVTSVTNKPIALCLAYVWGRNLDGSDDNRDLQSPAENPGASVVTLLDQGEAHWAIVTNGKIWRLYSAKTHSRATNYYEIDLEETLALPPTHLEEAFRYFWLLFRAAAFTPTPAQATQASQPSCFLDSLLSESARYARELGERLKERIFEDIFPHFARGFILHARRTNLLPALDTLTAEESSRLLEPFFSGTLTFLYRMLFLLYAESRDLLPVRELHGYHRHSLERLKKEIAEHGGPIKDQAPAHLKHAYNELSTANYDRLQELFSAVDKGNSDLNVPVYNGGLFMTQPDPADSTPEAAVARFLASHKIPDRQLALGLDLMTRDLDDKTHALAMIDYKSLGVRQLGSIYEGLLEFKLRIAPVEMAVVKGKKAEEIIPYAEAQQKKLPILKEGRGKDAHDKTLPTGHIYLENDRRERKASGSYYTPDYIVKYIVEHTVGPVLTDKLESLRPAFRAAEKTLRAEQDKYKALQKQHLKGDTAENETYKKHRALVNEVFFDLKVLDPAMGSGHFLVEAVDYITDQMAKFLTAFKWNPVVHELARTRRDIQAEMARQSITIDSSKLTDLNLLKRQVLKRCIYGVDLNPMAVELAKVSLWLDCFTLGAPLSFLDHHMKAGNSLIGGSVQEVQSAIGSGLWGNQFAYLLDATQLMRRVGELSDVTAQEVAESRKAYQGAYDALAPFKRLLDVWTSEYFANKAAQQTTRDCAGAIFDNNYSTINKEDRHAIETALTLSHTKRFFHWELEFPEVFYDATARNQNGGFDAVVGNPPYVRQEGLGDDKTAFKALYEVFNSIADLYTYFIERGNKLLRHDGRFGMITANKFMRANYGAALRSFLTTQTRLETLIDFGELRVFGDAATDPLITISSKAIPATTIAYVQVKSLSFDSLNSVVKANAVQLPESAFVGSSWSLVTDTQQTLLNKLKINSMPLDKYVNGKIQYGIKTGFNEAFVIDRATHDRLIAEDARSAEIIKPFLVGDDVRKYSFDFQDRYLIWTFIGVPINNYPAIYRHLQQYQTQLEKRWDKGKFWWELRHCDYYDDFENPKIIYPDMSISSKFVLDTKGYYTANTTYIIPSNDMYMLALLNSNLLWNYFKKMCTALGDANERGRLRMFSIFMEPLPIRRINFTLSPEQRTYYLEKAKNLYQYCLSKDDQQCVLGFVEHHLSQQPEQSDVVHDLLAFLAEEMMRLNKQKRAAMQEFLASLVSTLHILPDKEGRTGIDVLTGKSKLADFPGDYQKGEPHLTFADLRDILHKNRPRLGSSLSDTHLLDRLERTYEQSLQHILPLKTQLAKTDALIDQIVYKLYGLTDDEIAVVEGKG